MTNHIRSHHPEKMDKVIATQPSMTTFLQQPRMKHSKRRKEDLDRKLLNMILKDLKPVYMVDCKGFRDFIQSLDPYYDIPSRRTIMNTLLPKVFQEDREEVTSEILNAESVSLTSDLWTSKVNTHAYISLTAHYISPNNNNIPILKQKGIACSSFMEAHTSINISNFLRNTILEHNIQDKVISITTDNAGNMRNSILTLPFDVDHIGCYAHKLNLAVCDAIKKVSELKDLRSKLSNIVRMTKKSLPLKLEFQRAQECVGQRPPLKILKQDVPTRWNSLYLMMERILDQKAAVIMFLSNIKDKKNNIYISSKEWSDLEDIVKSLAIAYFVTQELCEEKNVSSSKMIPMTKQMLKAYSNIVNRSQFSNLSAGYNLSFALLDELNHRFSDIEEVSVLAKSSILDPRFQKRGFRDSTIADITIQKLKEELLSSHQSSHDIQIDNEELERIPSSANVNCIWGDFFEEANKSVSSNDRNRATAENELNLYLTEQPVNKYVMPLLWWHSNRMKYPLLSKLAFKYLSVQATSVSSERLFSTAGQILNDRRNRLSESNAEKMIILHNNLRCENNHLEGEEDTDNNV
ncbi:Uncharacterized protein FKW44_023335 [Caligus rogercresseyi]|uniref:HAT C-terminal dimerisation domain-containing protein n=1 Tax=Caligus rogercresseyi TaxID=217165 RepID=A0A7T8GPM4_CALRO|nr:Uncharacterized protein FKW44_023335 [Caligus rogercresseyi]